MQLILYPPPPIPIPIPAQGEPLFRATVDGFTAAHFHRKCDTKPRVLVIARSAQGHVFGGFSTHPWGFLRHSTDATAFLFTVINPHGVPPTVLPVHGSDVTATGAGSVCPSAGEADGQEEAAATAAAAEVDDPEKLAATATRLHRRGDFAAAKALRAKLKATALAGAMALAHNPRCGPCYGFGPHDSWHDLCIVDKADVNPNSASYLGHRYADPTGLGNLLFTGTRPLGLLAEWIVWSV